MNDKGNSHNFYKVLKNFSEELINEWVSAENQGSEFTKKGAKIVIIADNASFHKKEEYLKKSERKMPNIYLEFIPEYSPNYSNPKSLS